MTLLVPSNFNKLTTLKTTNTSWGFLLQIIARPALPVYPIFKAGQLNDVSQKDKKSQNLKTKVKQNKNIVIAKEIDATSPKTKFDHFKYAH